MTSAVIVIGAGLAGSEAAWQLAERGVNVELFEMRPARTTPAHSTPFFAELVCSNSLRSNDPLTAVGTLKREMRGLGSLTLRTAEETSVPAGGALAVDREAFSRKITEILEAHPRIRVVREEVSALPESPAIIAAGPLASDALSHALIAAFGAHTLSFYDAIAPIVDAATLTPGAFFRGSRYDEETSGDYLNVPLAAEEYETLVRELAAATPVRHLEKEEKPRFFEGCLPVEEMARRGADTLRFGPLKPVGLDDPETGRRPHAVIQLRKEKLSGDLYNLVGFQTQLSIPDQERILRAIPAFQKAVFIRHGSAHRNTFLNSRLLLNPDLSFRERPHLKLAGQISGVEGYVESAAMGLLAGLFTALPDFPPPPETTVIGGLLRHVTSGDPENFEPMKANWGLVPPPLRVKRADRKLSLAKRSEEWSPFNPS